MEIPDVKKDAHRHIDSLEGNILAIIQIACDDKGHLAVCVGGIHTIVIDVLSKVMKDNHQIKDIFEAAWVESTSIDINPIGG